MIAAAGLLAYAALLLAAAAPALARAAWPDRAPRLAIGAWLALAWSAIVSVVLGGAVLLVPAAQVSADLARLLEACAMTLRAHYINPGGMPLAWCGLALAVTVSARLSWCTAATLAARAQAGRRHRHGLRLAGRADARLGAIVIDHSSPVAWCLPGTRRPIVLTTAAVRALNSAQLTAVLAHEKAHQSGRHHLLVALAAAPAAAFPLIPAFRHARDHVARLAELAADDAAAAVSPRLDVAEALLTLAAAPVRSGAAALGAGGATAARIRRMIAAPNPLSRIATAGWTLTVALLIALPLAVLAGPAIAALYQSCCPQPAAAALPCPQSHDCTTRTC